MAEEVDLRYYRSRKRGLLDRARGALSGVAAAWDLRAPLRPLCGGRIVVGQLWPNLVMSLLATAPLGLGIPVYLQPLLGAGPLLEHPCGLLAASLLALLLALILATALRNPGLVERGRGGGAGGAAAAGRGAGDLDESGCPAAREICLNNVWVQQRFCPSCSIWRPPRSKHMRNSGYCVDHFDHYCKVLGTIIGRGNMLAFAGVVHCGALLSLLAVGTLLLLPLKWDAAKAPPDVFLPLCYCCLWLRFLGQAAARLWFLAPRNLTANEYLNGHWGVRTADGGLLARGSYADRNPFDYGWLANCRDFYCGPSMRAYEGS